MRLLALLPLLAATVFASESEAPSESPSPATSSPSSSSTTEPEPTPVGQLWTAQWDTAALAPYTTHCRSRSTFKAGIYTLGEMYPALKTWSAQLKVFYHKSHYPGSWEGVDIHGTGRELLKMDYEELPYAVREWLTRNPKQRHFSVQEDVVFFAPGAIYPILPLWVEEADGEVGECEGLFEDLENYSPTPKDSVVLGKLSHKETGKNEVEITIEAFQVKQKAGEAKERDEL